MKVRNGISVLMLATVALFSSSCDEDTLQSLSSNDTVAALKEALNVGVGVAVEKLGKDGYAAEVATKIGLPEEAQAAFTAINALQKNETTKALLSSLDIDDKLEENMVQLFNDAATEAAPEAAGVFVSAIKDITVQDGEAILFGGDGAATAYLKDNTYTGLQAAFNPTITRCMGRVSIAGMNANQAWTKFAGVNNKLADILGSTAGQAAIAIAKATGKIPAAGMAAIESVGPVDDNISDYVTGRALDGLFLKVSEKENDIRSNAAARTSDLLKRVFGRLDE